MNTLINADRSREAVMHGASLPWIPSPESGVERRMLERDGGEVARASTIVRYRPDSRFPPHVHGGGEEFLVLEGVFSDERGDYSVGTYVRNPPGSVHAPFSREGCVIFVKLRQMSADESAQVVIRPEVQRWSSTGIPARERAILFENDRTQVSLERLGPTALRPANNRPGGEEIFVVEGEVTLIDAHSSRLQKWSWSRYPGVGVACVAGETGATLWVKRGHLT